MGNIMVRMGVVIGTLLTVQAGFWYVGLMTHPNVVEPARSLEEFPMEVALESGTWKGQTAKLDEQTFYYTEADFAVSRVYFKDGRRLSFLLAEYNNPRAGLYHNPMNCYNSQGFTLVSGVEMRPLKARNRPETKVSLATWERKNVAVSEKVMVVYWYEVGDYTMYERHDLLKTQWAMRGKRQWPVMFKVLLEMPVGESVSKTETDILNMAEYTREWLASAQPKLDQ
jgi:EpsI family protein